MKNALLALALVIGGTLTGCLGMPDLVRPVSNFQLDRYLGTWHEIARLDHSFERGLTQVSAHYTRNTQDGSVRVRNRGFMPDSGLWKESVGRAVFVDDPQTGYLKVSFFGPFYGSYVVFYLDQEHYQYAFVSGPNTDYLWLLARSPEVPAQVRDKFIAMSKARGFDVAQLIFN